MANQKLEEKTLHSELVWQGRLLKVMRDQVELPNGDLAHREYILHPGAAVILPVESDGRLILIEQYRHALKRTFLEVPAGKRDKGEDPLVTAHRELEEETGFRAGKMEYMTQIHPVIGYANEVMHLYRATELTPGPQRLDPEEFLEVQTFSSDELKIKVRNGEITDVKTLISLFWYWSFK